MLQYSLLVFIHGACGGLAVVDGEAPEPNETMGQCDGRASEGGIEACRQCMLCSKTNECRDLWDACDAEPSCGGFPQCTEACPGQCANSNITDCEKLCIAGCQDEYDYGGPLFEIADTCSFCVACSQTCGGC